MHIYIYIYIWVDIYIYICGYVIYTWIYVCMNYIWVIREASVYCLRAEVKNMCAALVDDLLGCLFLDSYHRIAQPFFADPRWDCTTSPASNKMFLRWFSLPIHGEIRPKDGESQEFHRRVTLKLWKFPWNWPSTRLPEAFLSEGRHPIQHGWIMVIASSSSSSSSSWQWITNPQKNDFGVDPFINHLLCWLRWLLWALCHPPILASHYLIQIWLPTTGDLEGVCIQNCSKYQLDWPI